MHYFEDIFCSTNMILEKIEIVNNDSFGLVFFGLQDILTVQIWRWKAELKFDLSFMGFDSSAKDVLLILSMKDQLEIEITCKIVILGKFYII